MFEQTWAAALRGFFVNRAVTQLALARSSGWETLQIDSTGEVRNLLEDFALDHVRVSASSGHRESIVGQIRKDPNARRDRWAPSAAGLATH